MATQKEQTISSQKTTCAECGATIDVPDGWSKIECLACGASLLIERKAPRQRGKWKQALWWLVILVPVMIIWPNPPQEVMVIATGLIFAGMISTRG